MNRSSMPEVLLLLAGGVMVLSLACGALIGWVLNIVKLAELADAGGPTVMLVLRAIGAVFLPIGAVLGYVK